MAGGRPPTAYALCIILKRPPVPLLFRPKPNAFRDLCNKILCNKDFLTVVSGYVSVVFLQSLFFLKKKRLVRSFGALAEPQRLGCLRGSSPPLTITDRQFPSHRLCQQSTPSTRREHTVCYPDSDNIFAECFSLHLVDYQRPLPLNLLHVINSAVFTQKPCHRRKEIRVLPQARSRRTRYGLRSP